jgi:predicted metal-dependent HD superfamily phosphohydrolase
MNSEIIQASKVFVQNAFKQSAEHSLFYHNWKHTNDTYNAVMKIAEHTEGISDSDKETLAIAALFHDLAHSTGSQDHEKDSAEMALKFLASKSYPVEQQETVAQLIMSTKLGHQPADLLEKIMQDGDFSHLGDLDYIKTTHHGLYEEIKARKNPDLTSTEWVNMCVQFVAKHEYHTEFAKTTFGPVKAENMKALEHMAEGKSDEARTKEKLAKAEKKKAKKKSAQEKSAKEKSKPELPEKGVETMFRAALRNHMSLSQIADNKANTLISVNGIIISIVLSALFPKLSSNPFLIAPGLSLLAFSSVTIIIAILSTIPKTTHGIISKKEVEEKKGNLIFFGNFHKMSVDEYEWAIGELMKDKDYLYKSLTRDLYYLGKVLNRKYGLLRWSYYIFISGLIITIGLFLYSFQTIGS